MQLLGLPLAGPTDEWMVSQLQEIIPSVVHMGIPPLLVSPSYRGHGDLKDLTVLDHYIPGMKATNKANGKVRTVEHYNREN